jgi:uroporphyrinogen-III synthase
VQKIEKLLESLGLIYYEFDSHSQSLIADKKYSQKHISDELIKITHALTKENILFYVDANQQLFFKKRGTLQERAERYFERFFAYLKNSTMNIYVLSDKKVKWAKNLPLFEIVQLPHSSDFASYDALLFTSQNAIHSVNAQSKNYKKIPSYVIAPQTAKALKELGGNLKYTGKAKHGDAFAQELIPLLKNKKALYLRGENVVSSLVEILHSAGVACDERVVYKTQCKELRKKKRLPKGSSVIFSSPSTIECFFKNMEWDESFSAIAIGKTTASYFPSHITPNIAETTSLESCVKKAIELKDKS